MKENQLKIFDNEEFGKVRVLKKDDFILFNLQDVSFALGYVKKNSIGTLYPRKDLIENICESLDITGVSLDDTNIEITKYIDFSDVYINEEDMYDLVFESKAKKAKEFRKWVTSEVLPMIRKTGGYVVENRETDFVDNYFPTLSDDLKKSIVKELSANNKKLQDQLEESKDKIEFADTIEFTKANLSMKEFIDLINVKNFGRTKFMKWLRDNKYLTQNNVPYRTYIDLGVFEIKEKIIKHRKNHEDLSVTTLITGKGQLYLYNKLKEASVIKGGIKKQNTYENFKNIDEFSIKGNIKPNKKMNSNNTSGVTGVTWDKSTNNWMATIKVGYKLIKLKQSLHKDDCIKARLQAELKYYGEFSPQSHLFKQYEIV